MNDETRFISNYFGTFFSPINRLYLRTHGRQLDGCITFFSRSSVQSQRQVVECDPSKFLPVFAFEYSAPDVPDQPVRTAILCIGDRLQLNRNEGRKLATGHRPVEKDFPAQILGEAFSIRQGSIVQLGLTSRCQGFQTCFWWSASLERLQLGFYRRSFCQTFISLAKALQSVFNWSFFCPTSVGRFGLGKQNLRGNNN